MSQITIHCQAFHKWFYTKGMSEYGEPELEMRNGPPFLEDAVSDILKRIVKIMLDSQPPLRIDEYLSIGDYNDSKTVFTFRQSVPISGYEEHFQVARWEVISVYDANLQETIDQQISNNMQTVDEEGECE